MANEPTKAPAITTLLPRLRASNPLIYCLSNSVTAQFVANVLYAVGASPLFCVDPLEAEDVAGKAGAMVVNLGTLDTQRRQAIDRAVPNAKRWVLDPVGIAGLSSRRTLARTLMTKRPSIVRGNASEILALDDEASSIASKGVDAAHTGEAAAPIAKHLGTTSGSVIAMTGLVDYVSGIRLDGSGRMVQLSGGHAYMAQITGMGCAVSALCAAFLAVADDGTEGAFDAAVSALHLASAAGGHAGSQESTKGPASFQVNFIDALSRVGAAT